CKLQLASALPLPAQAEACTPASCESGCSSGRPGHRSYPYQGRRGAAGGQNSYGSPALRQSGRSMRRASEGSVDTIKRLSTQEKITLSVSVLATLLTLVLRAISANNVVVFLVSAVALAALASMVGDGTDHLGQYLGAGATGVLQSALGNL